MANTDLIYFFTAANNGDIIILENCLKNGIDIHSCNDLALRLAVKENHEKAVLFLLSHGANVQAVYDDSLRRSSLQGEVETVKSLLESNCCSQEAKIYAMYNAIFGKYIGIIKLLLNNGVSPADNNGAVFKVAKLSRDELIISLFQDYLN